MGEFVSDFVIEDSDSYITLKQIKTFLSGVDNRLNPVVQKVKRTNSNMKDMKISFSKIAGILNTEVHARKKISDVDYINVIVGYRLA